MDLLPQWRPLLTSSPCFVCLRMPQMFELISKSPVSLFWKHSVGVREASAQTVAVIRMQYKAQQHLPALPWFFRYRQPCYVECTFPLYVCVNQGVWGATVDHAADGDFMAQSGKSLREECWLLGKMKPLLHRIHVLDYYITKKPNLGSDCVAT